MSQKLPYLEVETVTPEFRDTGFLTSLCVKWHFKQQLCSPVFTSASMQDMQILRIFLKSFRFIISCHLLSLKQFHLLKTTSFYMSKNASILIKVTICDRCTKCLFQECCSLWKRVCLKEKLFLGSVYLPRWRDLFFQWRLSQRAGRESELRLKKLDDCFAKVAIFEENPSSRDSKSSYYGVLWKRHADKTIFERN